MSISSIKIGSAVAKRGEIAYGSIDAVELPTGGWDQFPVILAHGRFDGPTLWVTSSIHGNEYTGIPTIHQLITPQLVRELHGTIVAIPTLNPAGIRTGERRAYYLRFQDPNRLFPLPATRRGIVGNGDAEPLNALEKSYRALFELVRTNGDYLIDLHNYSIGAFPFSFRDPVGYHNEIDKSEARQLLLKTDAMIAAFGHTVINEYASSDYLKRNLHRSVSGAILNTARIPSFTVELGGYLTVDPAIVNAAVIGLRNVLRWAGMLTSEPEPITGITILNPGYPIRRMQHPYAPRAGITNFLVKPGDAVAKGDPVVRMTDIWGRPLGSNDGIITTEHDGFVLGLGQGAAFYENDPLMVLAIRDISDPLVPFL